MTELNIGIGVDQNIELGDTVRDLITGFEGIAISRIEYLNGCVQICVKPPVDKDGKMRDGEYIDIGQLVVAKTRNPDVSFGGSRTSGAMPDTPGERYANG